MKKNSLLTTCLVFFLVGFISNDISAQRSCGTYEHYLEQLEQNPRFKEKIVQIEAHTKSVMASPERIVPGVITIPVHVIVVYANSLQNISNEQIESQITVLNEDYRKLNSDWDLTPSEFYGLVSDIEIEFTLQAIERHSNSTSSWGTDDQVKLTYPPYSPNTHLNIWVCNIGGGILGYAQFPGGDPATDGVVIGPQYFGSSDYDDGSFYLAIPYDKGRTATHEIGHWLNLHHVWGDDQSLPDNCSGSDNVDDTPNQAVSYGGCPSYPQNSCGSNDMFINYMDYVDDICMFMFSEGQKNRIRSIFVPGGPRELMVISPGLVCDAEACDGNISLSMTLDNYPEETSWTLTDSNGIVLDEGFGYSTPDQTINENWGLEPGKYIFSVYDSYGDGFCCFYGNGSYSLTDGCSNVIQSGGSFARYESITFCVQGEEEIIVTSPNGGENWQVGSIQEITWTSSGTSGNVHIEYSTDNGITWAAIIASTPDDGSFDWTVPDNLSTQCLVKISDTDGNPDDSSDALFAISEGIIPPGLLAYYPFNGNANDESGNENHGTVYGSVLTADRFGIPNSAYSFDGINDYIGTGQSLLNDLENFTLSGWIQPTTSGSHLGFWGQNENIEFGFLSASTVNLWIESLSGNLVQGYPYPSGEWHFIVAVGDGDSLKLYIDGELANYILLSASNYGNSAYPFNIGGGGIFDVTGNFFEGNIDDIRVYNIALSISEIQAFYRENDWDIPPAAPQNLTAKPGNKIVTLSWYPNTEPDMHKYNIYRAMSSPTTELIDSVLVTGPDDPFYTDEGLIPGQEYFYRVTAVNNSYRESGYSNEVNSIALDATVDSLALVALYNATDGPNWTINSDWLTGNLDTWFGLTLVDGMVTEIDLEANNLTGIIPSEIGTISQLESLVLDGNNLTGPIPSEIGNLVNLTNLHLVVNDLTGGIPPEIGNLTKLISLYLSNNNLSGDLPVELGNLVNLRRLILYANEFSGTIPDELGYLTDLTHLYLNNMQLSGEIPLSFGNLINSEVIRLHNNQLTGSVPIVMNNLGNLTELTLANNDLDELPPLNSLTNLVTLTIQGNQFTFGDIEPNIGIPSTTFTYSPQDSVSVKQFIEIEEGDIDTLHISVDGLNNIYQWYKGNSPLPGEINDSLILSLVSLGDAGIYSCRINNTVATDLTLYSQPFVVTILDTTKVSTPQYLTAIPDDQQVTLRWNKNPETYLHRYEIYRDNFSPAITLIGSVIATSELPDTNFTDFGLINENTYYYRIRAIDSLDNVSNYSEEITITPYNPIGDSLSLVALYNATDGDNWDDNSNWLAGPLNTWSGITLTEDRVTDVDLEANNLTGVIPPEIGDLYKLDGLDLSGNNLSGTIPPEIGNLVNLTDLHLVVNDLTGGIPPEIGNLTNLISLYLSNNDLTGDLPVELGNLINLRRLILYANQFTGILPGELGYLTNLTHIYLNNNQLEGEIPSSLGNLTDIVVLRLHNNQLTGAVPASTDNLSSATELTLAGNNLVDLPELTGMSSLITLTIQNNQFTFEDIEPNLGVASTTFTYSPQAEIGEEQFINLLPGSSHTFSVSCGGSNNQYQWFKNGTLIPGASLPDLELLTVTETDAGDYVCEVTSTIVTGLTINTNPIHITVSNLIDQEIALSDGWNIFSLYVTPDDVAMMSIVQPLIDEGSLIKIQNEAGAAIEPIPGTEYWIDNIHDWENTEGYKIRVNDNTTLNVSGIPIALPLTIDLAGGWNIISYPASDLQNAMNALDELIVADNLIKVQNEAGAAIEPIPGTEYWIDNIHDFMPGEGYKVRVNVSDDLTIHTPAKSAPNERNTTGIEPAVYFNTCWKGNGLDHMNIYLYIANSGLQAGDEIGIFDGNLCVGAGRVVDPATEFISMVASCDDPTTLEIDGFAVGNTLQMKVLNDYTKKEHILSDTEYLYGTTDRFEPMGTAIIRVKSAPDGMVDLDTPVTWLGDNYPNPFSQTTTIPFAIGEETVADLAIYDIMGQRINTLVHATLTPGFYSAEWNESDSKELRVLPGIYLVKLVAANKVFVRTIEVCGN